MLQSNIAPWRPDFNAAQLRISYERIRTPVPDEGPRSGRSSITSTATRPAARNTAPAANSQRNNSAKSAPARRAAAQHVERQPMAAGVDAAQHDRGERRDDDGAAELAGEVERAGRGAELVRRDRVLHDGGGDRIHHAEARAADRQQHADLEQRQPAGLARRTAASMTMPSSMPTDRHELVVREPHHQPAGEERADRGGGQEHDQRGARAARREAQHQLEINRHEDRQPDDDADAEEARRRGRRQDRRAQHGERNERLRRARHPPARTAATAPPPPPSKPKIGAETQRIARAAPASSPASAPAPRTTISSGAEHVEPVRPVVARQLLQRAVGHPQRQQCPSAG